MEEYTYLMDKMCGHVGMELEAEGKNVKYIEDKTYDRKINFNLLLIIFRNFEAIY